MAGKPGQGSKYTEAKAKRICELLATGESLERICKRKGMPDPATVRRWNRNDVHGFAPEYARARDDGLDAMADSMLSIADDDTLDANDRRVRLDARKWYLSKLAPKRYGDRMTLAGDREAPLEHRHTSSDAELEAIIAGGRKQAKDTP